ncbi:MAG: ferritin family protein [Spirochaetales bacterium]|jgi:rubrerythrin|nr:ferritin family protein [Spirochaetales bacterium]
MAHPGSDFLVTAIHSEIVARDAYIAIGYKIDVEGGKKVMKAMAAEEDEHRHLLAGRYKTLTGKDFIYNPDLKPGPDFSFIEKSTFGRTDALEALRLALGAEEDAIRFYSGELEKAADRSDVKMLNTLIRFERGHKKKLEKEIKRLQTKNHWNLS